MEIRNIEPSGSTPGLRGAMKVVNALQSPDMVTLSGDSGGGILHKMSEKIKGLFSDDEKSPKVPPKEKGGWIARPDGSGSDWFPQSTPPPPRNTHGHWLLNTSCGSSDWIWVKDTSPADGPDYEPGYNPRQSGDAAK